MSAGKSSKASSSHLPENIPEDRLRPSSRFLAAGWSRRKSCAGIDRRLRTWRREIEKFKRQVGAHIRALIVGVLKGRRKDHWRRERSHRVSDVMHGDCGNVFDSKVMLNLWSQEWLVYPAWTSGRLNHWRCGKTFGNPRPTILRSERHALLPSPPLTIGRNYVLRSRQDISEKRALRSFPLAGKISRCVRCCAAPRNSVLETWRAAVHATDV